MEVGFSMILVPTSHALRFTFRASRHPAIGDEERARDVAGGIRAEVDHAPRHILRPAKRLDLLEIA